MPRHCNSTHGKTVLRICLGLTLWCLAARSAQISISNVSAQPGASAAAEVIFAGQGDYVAGLQFDLEFDTDLTITTAPGVSSIAAGKNLGTASLAHGGTRFLVIGLNQNIITDGALLSLEISIPAGTVITRQLLHISNAAATGEDGNAISLSAVDSVISVDVPAPAILAVVDGASFLPSIVDGSWISILGTNLAPTTQMWQPDEIVNGRLPTLLDGVRVTVGGLPAAISYISPTQLNVQAPMTGVIGLADVVVTSSSVAGPPAQAEVRRNSPGVFCFTPGGGRYPAAVIAPSGGGVDYVGPAGLFGTALVTRPARPGEIIELYVTGLGPTNPAVPAGQIFSGAAPIVDPVTVNIGGVAASVGFAGLTGTGLYQLNVTVPNLPPGDQPLTINMTGAVSQPGVFLTVGP